MVKFTIICLSFNVFLSFPQGGIVAAADVFPHCSWSCTYTPHSWILNCSYTPISLTISLLNVIGAFISYLSMLFWSDSWLLVMIFFFMWLKHILLWCALNLTNTTSDTGERQWHGDHKTELSLSQWSICGVVSVSHKTFTKCQLEIFSTRDVRSGMCRM